MNVSFAKAMGVVFIDPPEHVSEMGGLDKALNFRMIDAGL